jgi:hypothetical protein
MTARAGVRADAFGRRVEIAIAPQDGQVYVWPTLAIQTVDLDAVAPENGFLPLPVDAARALYEALAQHFGGNASDTRQLRGDYDAERKRVDKMIDALIKGQV